MCVPPLPSKAVGFLMKAWFQIQQVMPEVLQPEQELKAKGPACELHGLINFDTLPTTESVSLYWVGLLH